MTSTATHPTGADAALKTKHAAVWASGDYPGVADEVVGSLGALLVETLDVQPGRRVLDVAAGTGSSALPAASAEGLTLTFEVADAEHLPYEDAAFDVVLSSIGVMFAPHHQEAADELLRVCRPGGTIGVLSWTPDGFIGQLFATMKPYAPPPPPGASPATRWGRADHVRTLFGDGVTDLVAHQQTLDVERFTSGAAFRDFMKAKYGPTIAVYRFIAEDAEKVVALDADMAALGDRFLADGVMEWEYLLVTARRV